MVRILIFISIFAHIVDCATHSLGIHVEEDVRTFYRYIYYTKGRKWSANDENETLFCFWWVCVCVCVLCTVLFRIVLYCLSHCDCVGVNVDFDVKDCAVRQVGWAVSHSVDYYLRTLHFEVTLHGYVILFTVYILFPRLYHYYKLHCANLCNLVSFINLFLIWKCVFFSKFFQSLPLVVIIGFLNEKYVEQVSSSLLLSCLNGLV